MTLPCKVLKRKIVSTYKTSLSTDKEVGGAGGRTFGVGDEAPKTPENITHVRTNEKVQVYRWRDENGVMQFANTPPLDPGQAEMVELRPDTNIVKAIEVPEEEDEKQAARPRVVTVGNPYTPSGMKDLLDTTSTLAEDMSEQQMEHQQLMNQILGIQQK